MLHPLSPCSRNSTCISYDWNVPYNWPCSKFCTVSIQKASTSMSFAADGSDYPYLWSVFQAFYVCILRWMGCGSHLAHLILPFHDAKVTWWCARRYHVIAAATIILHLAAAVGHHNHVISHHYITSVQHAIVLTNIYYLLPLYTTMIPNTILVHNILWQRHTSSLDDVTLSQILQKWPMDTSGNSKMTLGVLK